jgi:transcription elongation factor GreA
MAEPERAISPEGKAKAEAELEHRRSVRRPEIVAAIKAAREFGDLSETAEYHAAREEQGHNEARIRVLEHHLATATVSAPAAGGAIGAGSRVRYRDGASAEEVEVTLVHRLEADLGQGKVSVDSPIAKALLGAGEGDTVTLETRRGAKQLEILSVG